ncbi:MAG: hypothetical protein RL685_5001, partial [Pseudomonadota bacterium]
MGVVMLRTDSGRSKPRLAWSVVRFGCLLLAAAGLVGACGRAPLGENQIQPAVCGNGLCDPEETTLGCSVDCFCGDAV